MTSPTTSRRRLYNATGDHYEHRRYGDPHMDSYRAFRNDTLLAILRGAFGERPLRILEVGCGTGPSLTYLAQSATSYQLFGLDASDTMLAQAAKNSSGYDNRPKLVLGDAGRLPFTNGTFDAMYATRFIHQFPHQTKQQIYEEFRRVVRPGGIVIIEFYARPYHWLRYYLGARKGRSEEAYFHHYPSTREVRAIVGERVQVYPLRLPGSRVLARVLGDAAVRRMTRLAGQASRGLILDEYFVVARQ